MKVVAKLLELELIFSKIIIYPVPLAQSFTFPHLSSGEQALRPELFDEGTFHQVPLVAKSCQSDFVKGYGRAFV